LPAERVRFLTLDEVLAIHTAVLAMGGTEGLRDAGLLESALFRPRTGYYATLDEMATALLESLFGNHPFVDGNKRTALIATDVFLRMNGWYLHLPAQPAFRFLMGLFERGQADFAHLLPWVKRSKRSLRR
jgi:death on curing protein